MRRDSSPQSRDRGIRASIGEQLAAIATLLEAGTMKPVLDRTFPFAETKEAVAYVEAGRSVGKVVVVRD